MSFFLVLFGIADALFSTIAGLMLFGVFPLEKWGGFILGYLFGSMIFVILWGFLRKCVCPDDVLMAATDLIAGMALLAGWTSPWIGTAVILKGLYALVSSAWKH